jgi:uncharacterized protein YutE (UPF0331/DUF86 family)
MTAEVLARKVAKVADKLQRIDEVGTGSLDQMKQDRSRRDLLAFYLALAVENCIDIAEHVIAERGWGAPDSYGEAFRLLAQHGVLSPTLAERMVQAAGMRNAILHEYDGIDWARVHAALSDLSRLREFIAAVQRFEGLS